MAQTFQHGQNSRLAFFFFSFFFFYSYRLLLRNTRASSKKYSYGYLNFYIFLSYFPGIHAIDRRNSKQVYLFLLKVLNRKKKIFSECLRTIGEIKGYFWNYYWLYHMLLFSEFFVNIQKIPFLWFWAFKTRFLLFSIDTYLDLSLALNGLWTSNWSYNNNISYKVWGKLDSSF